jgi:hypothetical protein
MFWVISVYFTIRNNLQKSGTYLLGQHVYKVGHTIVALYGGREKDHEKL